MVLRVVSGSAKGTKLISPDGLEFRPTLDRVKEAIFSMIGPTNELLVLDLFSGTGSISYEFASRGAVAVTSVEINAVHHNFIRQTAQQFGFSNLHPVKANVFLYLKSCVKKYDVIFSDAPYDLEGSEKVIEAVWENDLLKEGGILIFEHSKSVDVSHYPHYKQTRSYGSVQFSIFEK